MDASELVNDDIYGDGWMLKIQLGDESRLDKLLSAAEYDAQISLEPPPACHGGATVIKTVLSRFRTGQAG